MVSCKSHFLYNAQAIKDLYIITFTNIKLIWNCFWLRNVILSVLGMEKIQFLFFLGYLQVIFIEYHMFFSTSSEILKKL